MEEVQNLVFGVVILFRNLVL